MTIILNFIFFLFSILDIYESKLSTVTVPAAQNFTIILPLQQPLSVNIPLLSVFFDNPFIFFLIKSTSFDTLSYSSIGIFNRIAPSLFITFLSLISNVIYNTLLPLSAHLKAIFSNHMLLPILVSPIKTVNVLTSNPPFNQPSILSKPLFTLYLARSCI